MANQTNKYNTTTEIINAGPVTNWTKPSFIIKDADGKTMTSMDIDEVTRQAKHQRVLTKDDLGQSTIKIKFTGDSTHAGGGEDTLTNHLGDSKTSRADSVTQLIAGPGIFVSNNGKGQTTVSLQPIPSKDINNEYYADLVDVSWTINDTSYPYQDTVDNSQFLIGGTGGNVMRSRDGENFVDLMADVSSQARKVAAVPVFETIQLQSPTFPDTGLVYWSYVTYSNAPSVDIGGGVRITLGLSSKTGQELTNTGTLAFIVESSHIVAASSYFTTGTDILILNQSQQVKMLGKVVELLPNSYGDWVLVTDIVGANGAVGYYTPWTITRTQDTAAEEEIGTRWGRLNQTIDGYVRKGDSLLTLANYTKRSDNGLSSITDETIKSSGCYYQPNVNRDFASTLYISYGLQGGIYRSTSGIPTNFEARGSGADITVDREYFNAYMSFRQNASNCSNRPTEHFRVAVADAGLGKILWSGRVGNAVSTWTAATTIIDGTEYVISGTPLWAMAYGSDAPQNSYWVAAGDNDTVWTSTNGSVWTRTETGWRGSNWRSCAYGNGRFVLVGQKGRIAYSEDNGATWTKSSQGGGKTVLGGFQHLNSIAYSPTLDTFCVVGDGRAILAFDGEMKPKDVSVNGATQETPEGSKTSSFGLIASSTLTTYGSILVLKAISDAALYKTVPVEFYDDTTSTYVSTLTTTLLGTSTFVNTTDAPLTLTDLSTGTHYIHAYWPGEAKFGEVTTESKPITITIIPGYPLEGDFTITSSPDSGTLVVGEGTATFVASFSTSTIVPRNVVFLDGQTQIGKIPIVDNSATLAIDTLDTGVHTITAWWGGGDIDGLNYEGRSTSIDYEILRGTDLTTTTNNTATLFTISINPSQGIYYEGTLDITASFPDHAELAGRVQFYRDDVAIQYADLVGGSATITINNTMPVGNTTFKAVWDGNQSSHPRYLELTTSTTWTVVARNTLPSLDLAITPNPTTKSKPTKLIATANTTSVIEGIVTFSNDLEFIGTATFVDNTATLITTTLSSGVYNVKAYWPGSAEAPKYYPITSNLVSLEVLAAFPIPAPLLLDIKNDSYHGIYGPFIQGEVATLTASIDYPDEMLTGPVLFYSNGSLIGQAEWNNNQATITTTFNSTGTRYIYADWEGALIGDILYSKKLSDVATITVEEGYRLDAPITLTAPSTYAVSEAFNVVASASTSTHMTNSVMRIYSNGILAGSATFNSSNIATIPVTLTTTGTFNLTGLWMAGNLSGEGGRKYVGQSASNAPDIFIDTARTLDGNLILSTNSATHIITQSTVLTAHLTSTSTINGGVVTFKDVTTGTTRVLGTATISSNYAAITIPANGLTSGTYSITSEWSGRTTAPKYFGKSSNTLTQIILPQSDVVPVITLSTSTWRYYNVDRSTNSVASAVITFPGVLYNNHKPGGTLTLYDVDATYGTQNQIASVTISNTTTYTFTWNPKTFSNGLQMDNGDRLIRVVYSGDLYNVGHSADAPFVAKTRAIPQFTLSSDYQYQLAPDGIYGQYPVWPNPVPNSMLENVSVNLGTNGYYSTNPITFIDAVTGWTKTVTPVNNYAESGERAWGDFAQGRASRDQGFAYWTQTAVASMPGDQYYEDVYKTVSFRKSPFISSTFTWIPDTNPAKAGWGTILYTNIGKIPSEVIPQIRWVNQNGIAGFVNHGTYFKPPYDGGNVNFKAYFSYGQATYPFWFNYIPEINISPEGTVVSNGNGVNWP